MRIKYIAFKCPGTMGHIKMSQVETMICNANDQALEWIAEQDKIEVINISTAFSNAVAITTVWYKKVVPVLKPSQGSTD